MMHFNNTLKLPATNIFPPCITKVFLSEAIFSLSRLDPYIGFHENSNFVISEVLFSLFGDLHVTLGQFRVPVVLD